MIRLSKSCLTSADIDAVASVLKEEYLGMGSYTKSFEDALSDYVSNDVVCVSSGTAALQLSLQACDIGPNDEVLVPSLTYLASFQAISATGATPVACDVDPYTFQITISDASQRLTSRTKAIMPVHYGGRLVRRGELFDFAQSNNLRVVEDAAHSFGSSDDFGICGSHCDIICFSFDGIKNITSGEGGAVVSSSPSITRTVSDLRLLGVVGDSTKRYSKSRTWTPSVVSQGWRYHMSNINAALGLSQFNSRQTRFAKRQLLSKTYFELLASSESVTAILEPSHYTVPHIYPILLPEGTNESSKADVRRELLESFHIETGCHYYLTTF